MRDTSEALPERVLALLEKHGGWQATLDYIAKLEAAAEPADAGRGAVAWITQEDMERISRPSRTAVIVSGGSPLHGDKWIPLYTRPPSEAAAALTKTAIEDVMAKYLGRTSRLYLYMQADIRTALASQQAAKP